jgi:hypothetical protein
VFVQNLPECGALSELFGTAAAERNSPIPEVDRVLRSFDTGGREIESESLRVAMNEIEDPVTACIHSCNKVGPCHRTLRWDAGGERSKISLSLEFGEVGHFAFAHEAMQELGIHSVDA